MIEWISIDDRLPSVGGDFCLVFCSFGFDVAKIDADGQWITLDYCVDGVTHWAEINKPELEAIE